MILRELFHPRSIALVGATDKSGWSKGTYDNLRAHGFGGDVYLVSRRGGQVHGDRAYSCLGDIPGPVDLAYVMVPAPAVLPVLREGADRGIRAYVVLTAGFAETGGDGAKREREIAEFALSRGLSILGPNGNGYINATARITPYGLPIPAPLLRGPVGIVLQSGALASAVLTFAQARNVGISLLVSMGNESVVSVADVVGHLVDDPATKVIALFLESVREPEKFARAARRALRAGKPIVALKVGRSDHARRTAEAHTGALTGNDAVSDAVFRQLGVIRVRSLEDLIITAALLAQGPGAPAGPRLGIVTPSGGASEIIADRAQDEGLELPAFAPATAAALAGILPGFATVANPLDVTGYVLVDRTLLGRALEIVAADPGIDTVALLSELPRAEPADPDTIRAVYTATAARIAASPKPVVVMSNALTDITAYGREFAEATGYPYVAGGIEHGMQAIGSAVRWARARRHALAYAGADGAASPPREPRLPPEPPELPARRPGHRPSRMPARPEGVWTEDRAAALLAANGVPVVPAKAVASPAAAVHAAEVLGYPVVLKAVSPGVAHKSDIGAVRLALPDAAAVRAAFHDVRAAALRASGPAALRASGPAALRASGPAADRGRIIVQPYRSGGIELIAGIVRDPSWGLVLAVGLGGLWVKALADTALRVLPADAGEIERALGELRGAAVLRGGRGTEPADLRRVAEVIARIGGLATELGDRLESLEVNPLFVRGRQVEALDALITWR